MSYFIHAHGNERYYYGEENKHIGPEVLAHHLAIQARFAGATRFHYSIGQHSLLVAGLLRSWGCPVVTQYHGLWHDAHEGVITDFTTPFQHWFRDAICNGVDYLEMAKAKIDETMMPNLGVPWPPSQYTLDMVKMADKTAFIVEAQQLFTEPPDWLDEYAERFNVIPPVGIVIHQTSPDVIEKMMINASRSLYEEMNGSQEEAPVSAGTGERIPA